LGSVREVDALGRPLPVGLADIGHAHVEESAGMPGVGGWAEGHAGLVVVGPPPVTMVSQVLATFMMTGVSFHQNLAAEQRLVELPGPVLVGDHKHVGDEEAFLGCGKGHLGSAGQPCVHALLGLEPVARTRTIRSMVSVVIAALSGTASIGTAGLMDALNKADSAQAHGACATPTTRSASLRVSRIHLGVCIQPRPPPAPRPLPVRSV
jgi:hypothetical protein